MNKYFIILTIFLLSSCATMFNGTSKNINIMTSNGDSVEADIISKNGVQTVTLPHVVNVKKGNMDISIQVKEDKCHRASSHVVNKYLDIFFLGNAFNYWTGTSTDIPNGAMWTYDDSVVVPVYRKDTCSVK